MGNYTMKLFRTVYEHYVVDNQGFYIMKTQYLFGFISWSYEFIGERGTDKPFETVEDLEEHLKYMKL